WRMRPGNRPWQDSHVRVREALAAEVHRLLRPRLANDLQALAHPNPGIVPGDAEAFEFLRRRAAAEAELQPAVGDDVDHGVGLRHLQWIAQRKHAYGDAEVDARRGSGNGGQKRRRFGDRAAVDVEVV